jgi:murein DD-endopeptidase MepM/ murein hydrolase activator NlpD
LLRVLAVAALLAPTNAAAAGCLLPPVDAPVARPFEAPPCQWCAGHRGITYAVAAGEPVRAAAAGTVTFSGVVVDVRYVVVRHGDGLLATYGGLSSTPLASGDAISAGAIIGRSGDGLYFGLRTGPDRYIDPQPLLGQLVVPPYLVPTDGTPRRPPPQPVLRCRPI